jgi:hypothetical protein
MRESRDFRERGNVGCELDTVIGFLVGGDRMRMRGRCVVDEVAIEVNCCQWIQ